MLAIRSLGTASRRSSAGVVVSRNLPYPVLQVDYSDNFLRLAFNFYIFKIREDE